MDASAQGIDHDGRGPRGARRLRAGRDRVARDDAGARSTRSPTRPTITSSSTSTRSARGETPFGGTIAHGFLTLSLVAPITQQLLTVSDASMAVNYGLDRVRFPAPLPVGAHWRGVATVTEVRADRGGRAGARHRHRRGRATGPSRRWSPTVCSGSTHERPAAPRRSRRDRHRSGARPRPRLRARARRGRRARRRQRRRRARRRAETVAADRRGRRRGGRPGRRRSARPRSREALVARAVERFGRLDIMVTNAGVLRDRVLWKMTDEDFDTVIARPPARHVHLRARGRDPDARAGRGRADHRRRLAGRPARQLRPDQLRGGEGRDRGVRAHLGARAGARADHRQRGRSRPPGPR